MGLLHKAVGTAWLRDIEQRFGGAVDSLREFHRYKPASERHSPLSLQDILPRKTVVNVDRVSSPTTRSAR